MHFSYHFQVCEMGDVLTRRQPMVASGKELTKLVALDYTQPEAKSGPLLGYIR